LSPSSEFGQQEAGKPDSNPVRRFVDRVIGPLVQGYFQINFAEYKIDNFVTQTREICIELENMVRQSLKEWDIEVIRTELHEFEPEGVTLDELRKRITETRLREQELKHMQENTEIEQQIEERKLVTEEQRRKLDAILLQDEIRLLGEDNVKMKIFLAELAKFNVPTVVAGNAESLLGYMSLPFAQDLIAKVFGRRNTASGVDGPKNLDTRPGGLDQIKGQG
jgi:hypothetical protein